MIAQPPIADLLFARYEKGGRGPRAFDCFGLFREICRRRGIAMPDHPTPDRLEDRQAAIRAGASRGWVALGGPEPWCAVVFRIGPFAGHLGTVLADGVRFIHASDDAGIAVERLDSPLWRGLIDGYHRWTGDE